MLFKCFPNVKQFKKYLTSILFNEQGLQLVAAPPPPNFNKSLIRQVNVLVHKNSSSIKLTTRRTDAFDDLSNMYGYTAQLKIRGIKLYMCA